MRSKFDQQLKALHVELIKMGALCEESIAAAMRYLLNGEAGMDQRAIVLEQEIDQKEKDIESLCLKLLLQQQPVARDLRTISSALKMISDMERIGDQAMDIAEIAIHLQNTPLTAQTHIKEMALAAVAMVTDSVESFVRSDLSMAQQVMRRDDEVDALFVQVKDELIAFLRRGQFAEQCIDLIMAAKYLERIGDHAVNIAEWVEYALTGKHRQETEELSL